MAFFEQMRYFFVFFILCGLWTSWQNVQYRHTLRLLSLFQILLTVLEVAFAVKCNEFYEIDNLSSIVGNSMFLSIILTHFVIAIESMVKNQAQIKLIRKFSSVNNLLRSKFGIKDPFRKGKFIVYIQLLVLLLIDTMMKISHFLIQFYKHRTYNFYYMQLCSEVIIFWRLIQILNFIHLLKCGLHLVYVTLTEIQGQLTQINFIQRGHTSKFGHFFVIHSKFDQLLCLKIIYGELHDICGCINDIFGWSLLMIFTEKFILFTLKSYWAFMNLTSNKPIAATILNASIIFPDILVLLSIAFYCSACSEYVILVREL